jgi:cell division protease FtsH
MEDKYFERKGELVDQLAYALGGRTAEELKFGDPSTGASNDIEKATNLARRMVMEFGMSDRLGPLRYGRPEGEVFLGRDYTRGNEMSDDVAAAIDEEVRKLITQAHEEAREILTTHMDALDRIAAELIEKETLDAAEVAEIFADVPKWEHTETGAFRIRAPEARALVEGGRVASTHSEEQSPGQG